MKNNFAIYRKLKGMKLKLTERTDLRLNLEIINNWNILDVAQIITNYNN